MKRYKVVREYLNRGYSLQKVGDIVKLEPDSPFALSLLENGFIESLKSALMEWEEKGILSHLAHVIIAPEDYAEDDKKYFTWEEACAIEKKLGNGWRLPTRSEWVLICEEFGQKDGGLDYEALVKNLGLARNGFQSTGSLFYAAGYEGNYWSSTPYSDTSWAYYLNFYGTYYINPSSVSSRYVGFSVRLVKDLEKTA